MNFVDNWWYDYSMELFIVTVSVWFIGFMIYPHVATAARTKSTILWYIVLGLLISVLLVSSLFMPVLFLLFMYKKHAAQQVDNALQKMKSFAPLADIIDVFFLPEDPQRASKDEQVQFDQIINAANQTGFNLSDFNKLLFQ